MSKRTKTESLGFDDLSEDIFGLSVRAFHTVVTVFSKPKEAFAAARLADWNDRRFTPSIRLVFSVMALLTAVRFLWAGDTSILYETVKFSVDESMEFASESARLAYLDQLLDAFVVAFTPTFMACHIVAALLLRIWGKGCSFALRLRFYFLGLLPGTIFSLFSVIGMSHLHFGLWAAYGLISIIVIFALDFLTVFRGGVTGNTLLAKAWRSVLFGLTSLVVSIATNIVSVTVAQIYLEFFGSQLAQ